MSDTQSQANSGQDPNNPDIPDADTMSNQEMGTDGSGVQTPDVADDSSGSGDDPMDGADMAPASTPDPPPSVADDSSGTGDDPMDGDELGGAGSAAPLPVVAQEQEASGSDVAAAGAAAAAAGGAGATAGMFASVVSAYIQCLDYPIPTITFNYNPDKYNDSVEAKWRMTRNPANNGTVPQFQGTVTPTLKVDILLDAFAMPTPLLMPSEVIESLKMLVLPTYDSMVAGQPAAPKVTFGWGANVILAEAFVSKVEISYQRFLLGIPVRATASVTLQEFPLPAPLGGTNPTSGGLATRRTHTVVDGDTLASISYREYKDAGRWRVLAEANGIDDPMRVKVGSVIVVPDRQQAQSWS